MGRRRLFGGTATALALLFFITCLPLLLEAKGGGGGKEERNCAFQSIEELNEELLPTLKELVKAPFFKFYRLSLCAQCAHKFPPPMCASPDCAVCECSSSDLPCDQSGRCFLAPESESQNDGDPSCDGSDEEEARLNLFVDRNMMLPWSENDRDPWTYDGHPNGAELSYVDLTLNPERWSGYSEKQGSTDIWRAIYSENCKTKDEGGVCEGEEAVFLQKLISGLHTSITMHIVSDSCLKQQKHGECLQWGPDVEGFKQRVISDPSRVSNMKELYILLIKAIKKAGQALLRVDYTLQKGKKKGEEEEEKKEQSHDDIKKIIEVVTRAADRCEVTRSAVEALPPLQETRAVFRNISSIMDCLGDEAFCPSYTSPPLPLSHSLVESFLYATHVHGGCKCSSLCVWCSLFSSSSSSSPSSPPRPLLPLPPPHLPTPTSSSSPSSSSSSSIVSHRLISSRAVIAYDECVCVCVCLCVCLCLCVCVCACVRHVYTMDANH